MAFDTQKLIVQGRLEDLEHVSAWIDNIVHQWNIPKSTGFAMQLCCEEIFSNTVRHGLSETIYQNPTQKEVLFKTDFHPAQISLIIEDQGKPFNLMLSDSFPITDSIDSVQIGGLGIHLVKKFSSSLNYERLHDKNKTHLIFNY